MKIFDAVVVSVPSADTAVVEVVRRTPHPMYRKLIKRSKKYKVDSAGQEVTVGARVKIVEIRPMSKSKYFKLVNLEEKKKGKKKNGSA